MTRSERNYQNEMLERFCSNGEQVELYLINGVRMMGAVISFDRHYLLLGTTGGPQFIAKHAISTIRPHSPGARPQAPAPVRPAPHDRAQSVTISYRRRPLKAPE